MNQGFEELEEENEEEEENLPDALGSFPDTRPPFSREDLLNAESLRTSEFKPVALSVIFNLPFTMEYKQSLARWAQSKFTKDLILSDTSPRKQGRFSVVDAYTSVYLSAKLDLIKCRITMSKSDTFEPAAHTIEDDLMFVFICLLSRTYGVKRERMINSIMKTESEMIQRTGAIEQKNEEKKSKGWFSRK